MFPTLIAATPYNETDLLVQVANGNENAFRRIFDYYWNHIYSVAFAFIKSPVLAEEIVQDVFLKVWQKRDQLPSVDNFPAYLFIMARNHIYNSLRKKSTEQPFVDYMTQLFQESSALPDQELLLKETNRLINQALQQLPVQQRAVYELKRHEGLDQATIAEKLNISRLTVKSHMNKALHFIRHYLQTHANALLIASLPVFHLLQSA